MGITAELIEQLKKDEKNASLLPDLTEMLNAIDTEADACGVITNKGAMISDFIGRYLARYMEQKEMERARVVAIDEGNVRRAEMAVAGRKAISGSIRMTREHASDTAEKEEKPPEDPEEKLMRDVQSLSRRIKSVAFHVRVLPGNKAEMKFVLSTVVESDAPFAREVVEGLLKKIEGRYPYEIKSADVRSNRFTIEAISPNVLDFARLLLRDLAPKEKESEETEAEPDGGQQNAGKPDSQAAATDDRKGQNASRAKK